MGKISPSTRYSGNRVSPSGHQPVHKQLLPDGEITTLSPIVSLMVRDHSPDGFQWGYSGSGPAQLALALLLNVTGDPETSQEFYQAFKESVVASWGDTWSVTSEWIEYWIKTQSAIRLQGKVDARRN